MTIKTGNSVTSMIIATKSVRLINNPMLEAPKNEENVNSIKPAQRMNEVRIVAFTVVR